MSATHQELQGLSRLISEETQLEMARKCSEADVNQMSEEEQFQMAIAESQAAAHIQKIADRADGSRSESPTEYFDSEIYTDLVELVVDGTSHKLCIQPGSFRNMAHLKALYEQAAGVPFDGNLLAIRYVDDENDMITIGSDEEMKESMRVTWPADPCFHFVKLGEVQEPTNQNQARMAIYTFADGTQEQVQVRLSHCHGEGGGFTIWIPSLQRERHTIAERLNLLPQHAEHVEQHVEQRQQVKISVGERTHICSVKCPLDLESLHTCYSSACNTPFDHTIAIRYIDDEGDLVTIGDEQSLREAVEIMAPSTLRFQFVPAQDLTASQSMAISPAAAIAARAPAASSRGGSASGSASVVALSDQQLLVQLAIEKTEAAAKTKALAQLAEKERQWQAEKAALEQQCAHVEAAARAQLEQRLIEKEQEQQRVEAEAQRQMGVQQQEAQRADAAAVMAASAEKALAATAHALLAEKEKQWEQQQTAAVEAARSEAINAGLQQSMSLEAACRQEVAEMRQKLEEEQTKRESEAAKEVAEATAEATRTVQREEASMAAMALEDEAQRTREQQLERTAEALEALKQEQTQAQAEQALKVEAARRQLDELEERKQQSEAAIASIEAEARAKAEASEAASEAASELAHKEMDDREKQWRQERAALEAQVESTQLDAQIEQMKKERSQREIRTEVWQQAEADKVATEARLREEMVQKEAMWAAEKAALEASMEASMSASTANLQESMHALHEQAARLADEEAAKKVEAKEVELLQEVARRKEEAARAEEARVALEEVHARMENEKARADAASSTAIEHAQRELAEKKQQWEQERVALEASVQHERAALEEQLQQRLQHEMEQKLQASVQQQVASELATSRALVEAEANRRLEEELSEAEKRIEMRIRAKVEAEQDHKHEERVRMTAQQNASLLNSALLETFDDIVEISLDESEPGTPTVGVVQVEADGPVAAGGAAGGCCTPPGTPPTSPRKLAASSGGANGAGAADNEEDGDWQVLS